LDEEEADVPDVARYRPIIAKGKGGVIAGTAMRGGSYSSAFTGEKRKSSLVRGFFNPCPIFRLVPSFDIFETVTSEKV
jgi:hypothetical protein